MDKEKLEARISQYRQDIQRLLGQKAEVEEGLQRLNTSIIATQGAIADCEYWLELLNSSEEILSSETSDNGAVVLLEEV